MGETWTPYYVNRLDASFLEWKLVMLFESQPTKINANIDCYFANLNMFQNSGFLSQNLPYAQLVINQFVG